MGCHSYNRKEKKVTEAQDKELTEIALIGNPNTGKSCLFNQLTGVGAVVSNYPGTTVDITQGKSRTKGREISVVDLPGAYALGKSADEERVTSDYILNKKFSALINVVDATLLERNLYFTLQLLEQGIPMVIALNFYEELEDKGIEIDYKKLSSLLGVPVIPIDALRGAGIPELIKTALNAADNKTIPSKSALNGLKKLSTISSKRNLKNDATLFTIPDKKRRLGIKSSTIRHSIAEGIALQVTKKKTGKKSIKERLDRFTTEPLAGTLSLVVVLGAVFFALFYLGRYLSEVLAYLFEQLVTSPLTPFISSLPSELLRTIIIWSLEGINAGIQIALPYIAVFYILMAFLEDTGYLSRMAYLLDKVMHKFYLHGKAVVPMMLGFGCSVPAILATRTLPTKKERILTSILICLIPCSARTAVILGAVGHFIGVWYALLIYGIILLLIFLVAYILGRLLPGESEGLILEMPEYRLPQVKNVLQKTWMRIKDFVTIAFPLIILGSLVLGILQFYNLLTFITKPFEPLITGWLLLPAVTGITLIYGILRKELALELLFVLGGSSQLLSFMNPAQIFIFALVVSLYFPCIGTFAVLKHEFGWKKSWIIALSTIVLAFIVGGVVGRLFIFFNLI